ncbi:MAG: hypothetical protein GYB65_04290 [Chloroflexi bacterium]|nr:hypothetical protein [Chloroflexota bacterium]
MGLTVQWDNTEQTVVRWDFAGRWSSDDFIDAVQHTISLAEAVPHSVYVLAMVRGVPPANLLDTGEQMVCVCWPRNLKKLLFVDATASMRSVLSLVGRACPEMPKIEFPGTSDEAYERITQLHLIEEYARS